MPQNAQDGLLQQAVVLESFDKPLVVRSIPVPEPTSGSVVVKVLGTVLPRYIRDFYVGKGPLRLDPPYVPNPNCVGRIHKVGPDAVKVKEGDLVYVSGLVHGRDNPDTTILAGHISGLPGTGAEKLAAGEFRDGALQQFQRVPLENVFRVNEDRVKELGINPLNLVSLQSFSMAAGCVLETADLRVAETVIIGPSGGTFGGSAVELALAAGGNVVALGRSVEKLNDMKRKLGNHHRLATVVMTGDDDVDAAAMLAATPRGAGADVYVDFSPTELINAPYLPAASRVMKRGGRIVIGGGAQGGIDIPYRIVLLNRLQVKGACMYTRQTLERVICMIEEGHLDIGPSSGFEVKAFGLDQLYAAVDDVEKTNTWRRNTAITPNRWEH